MRVTNLVRVAAVAATMTLLAACEVPPIPNPFASPPKDPGNCFVVVEPPTDIGTEGRGKWFPYDMGDLNYMEWQLSCPVPTATIKSDGAPNPGGDTHETRFFLLHCTNNPPPAGSPFPFWTLACYYLTGADDLAIDYGKWYRSYIVSTFVIV